jgi:hypothetical protein
MNKSEFGNATTDEANSELSKLATNIAVILTEHSGGNLLYDRQPSDLNQKAEVVRILRRDGAQAAIATLSEFAVVAPKRRAVLNAADAILNALAAPFKVEFYDAYIGSRRVHFEFGWFAELQCDRTDDEEPERRDEPGCSSCKGGPRWYD